MNKKKLLEISKVTLSDGSTYDSSWVLPNTSLRTDVDSTVHAIWNTYKDTAAIENKGRVSTFNKRFGESFSLNDTN